MAWFRRPQKPEVPSTGGHRGIATGLGTTPTQRPDNRALLTPDDVKGFLYNHELLIVNSSNVAAAQYFPEEHKMMVEYLGGGAYLYSSVSELEAASFAQAHSKGVWCWDHLRVRGSKTQHRKPFERIRSVLNVARLQPLPEVD